MITAEKSLYENIAIDGDKEGIRYKPEELVAGSWSELGNIVFIPVPWSLGCGRNIYNPVIIVPGFRPPN